MIRNFIKCGLVSAVILSFGILAAAQDKIITKKDVVVNPDGSYTVIEYPVGKEVTVSLLPSASLNGGKGTARVIRSAEGSKVYFDVSGMPATGATYYAYAVDPSGTSTLLGPITVANGVGTGEFTTSMGQFMLVLSPTEGLTTYDQSTAYVYRSDVPQGYAIVPRRVTSTTKAVARATAVDSTYDVPLLGVPKFNGKTTEVRVNFGGDLRGLDGKAYLKPEGGKTTIKMRFSDLRKAPADKRLVLWASAPDGAYTKIGQIINTGSRDESEIRGETALADFGLLVTVEDVDVERPTSRTFSTFTISPTP